MNITNNKNELIRLQKDFEKYSSKYYDISLSLLNTRDSLKNHKFHEKHHIINLWQYYGKVGTESSFTDLKESLDLCGTKFGIIGSEFSLDAVIEGDKTDLFKKMADRAGSLLNNMEVESIGNKLKNSFHEETDLSQVFVHNTNPLAVWISFLIYHLSITQPKSFCLTKIKVDPFAASLTVIDHLIENNSIEKRKYPLTDIINKKFKVALSFPGEKREYVKAVTDDLISVIGEETIFYDNFYKAELARPNLDTLLQKIYHKNSELIVVFLCSEYNEKEWCGLEWRAIRDKIKNKEDEKIMFLRFDDADVDGVFSIDGYIDLRNTEPQKAAELILRRIIN